MDSVLNKCIEEIRLSFNYSDNRYVKKRLIKTKISSLTKKQEKSMSEAKRKAKNKLGKRWSKNFTLKKIERKNKNDFLNGLKTDLNNIKKTKSTL